MSETTSTTTPPKPSGWSRASLILFGVILVALTAVGLYERTRRPPLVQGLPDDPAVQAGIMALGRSVTVRSGDLRFETGLDHLLSEPQGIPAPPGPPDYQRLAEGERWFREAGKRHRSDPRIECLLGHLDLARHRFEGAERHYAAALWRGSRYGEARLGLGVTLALRAQTEGNIRRARALTLRAIGQLAAVDTADPFYLPALYDRALLLDRVGRPKEAVAAARQYLEVEPRSAWAASLLRMIAGDGQAS